MLQNLNVCEKLTPVVFEDGAETALVQAHEETDMIAVGEPGFSAALQSCKDHSHVDPDICLFPQVLLFETRLCNIPNELFAFQSRLLICLLILASDKMIQPR